LGKGYGERIHISGPNDRIQTIRETWARDVPPEMDLRFFYGAPDPFAYPVNGIDEVLLNVEDDYAHLPDKVFAICRWAVENDYDFMLKADDDTAVYPHRLLAEIKHKQFHYAGYMAHIGTYASGGPGYWLNRKAMAIVAESTPHTWAEDMCVGEILRKSGIKPVSLPSHKCGLAAHWFNVDNIPPDTVTMHAVDCESMRKWYAREHP
jgi:Galactosyltransferase